MPTNIDENHINAIPFIFKFSRHTYHQLTQVEKKQLSTRGFATLY